MDSTTNASQPTLQPQNNQEEPALPAPAQTILQKITTTIIQLKAKFIAYREQKQREKMQRINLDVTKQQWGDGTSQEAGKTTNIAPQKTPPPPQPKHEGLH